MSSKLPPEFDAQRYLAAYPDVALSGLDPATHFLRFGRLMGRSPAGKDAGAKVAAAQPAVAARDKIPPAPPQEAPKQAPIIDRPSDFEPAEVIPTPAPPKHIANKDGIVSLEALALGPFESAGERDRLCASLSDYARMLGLPSCQGIPSAPNSGLSALQTGETRIENLWFAGETCLRMMIGGGAERSASKGWSLRAYQALPDNPAAVREAGQGVQFPASGPVFHDIELVHPLMPVILELSDSEGRTRALALLPFPSLLPGGTHWAELKALQSQPNPMDAFWSLSDVLLREHLGNEEGPRRSIAQVLCPEYGDEHLPDWLACVFGLTDASPESQTGGLKLTLPAGGVPTITALVSRRLELGTASATVPPFLVAERPGSRPRWSVALPKGQESDPRLPVLEASNGTAAKSGNSVPIHAAIILRPATPSGELVETSRPAPAGPGTPVTVVLDAFDADRTRTLVQTLRGSWPNGDIEFLVRAGTNHREITEALDGAYGRDGWIPTTETHLPNLARGARNERMLTLNDQIDLDDIGTLSTLLELLGANEDVASAACVLLGEARIRKQSILQTASGGLFPAAISFASSPRLSFCEPDVLGALPNLTYAVVANTMLCTMWRTRALAELNGNADPSPDSARDIRLGLDLMTAGHRNLCTTLVNAKLHGAYRRRDVIDPVGSLYLGPEQWEELLGRVTVLRELF